MLSEGDGVRGIRGTAGEGVSVGRTGRETTIDTAAQDFATTIVRLMVSTEALVFRILEAGELTTERQQDVARRTLTVLGNNNLRHAVQVVTLVILIDMVVFRTVHKEHHVGILLDSSRLTEVAQLRALTLQTITALDTTVQLRQGQDGHSFANPFNEREMTDTSS